jgi:hypothetical protein
MKWVFRIGITVLLLVLTGAVMYYSYSVVGFPANKNGLKRLMMYTHVRLSQRDVYMMNFSDLSDDYYIFRFQSSTEEIEKIVDRLNLIKSEYDGTPVNWRYVKKTYWWKPKYSSKGVLYKSKTRPYIILFYETDTKWTYFSIYE